MNAETLGKNIRFYRKKIGLTQAELAHRIDRSENIIPRWERGEIQPKAQNIPILAKALGITSSQLLDETDKKTQYPDKELSLAYWGEVADNIRKLLNNEDKGKIAIIKSMLINSLELINIQDDSKFLIKQENVGHDAIANVNS